MIKEFMIFCSGADSDILKECPKLETNKYTGIGAAVFFTGVFAFISGAYALYRVFYTEGDNSPIYWAFGIGLVWALMIFNLDRYIVSSMRKSDSNRKEVLTALPRILIAIMISLVIAKPLEVRIFQDRITAQISDNELTKRESDKNRILGITNKDLIDSLKIQSKNEVAGLEARLKTDPPTTGFREALDARNQAQQKHNKVYRETRLEIANAEENINFINNDDKYKVFSYVGEEMTEENKREKISDEGVALLAEYRNKKQRSIDRNSISYRDLKSKKDRVLELRKQHRDALKVELNKTKERDEEIALEQQQATSLSNELTQKTNKATETAFTNTFITQVEALGDLTAWKNDKVDEDGVVLEETSNSMFWMNLAIIILFILIETAPVIVKLLSKKGIYEDKIIGLESESENVTETNIKLNVANNQNVLQIDSTANKVLMDRITSAQIEIAEQIVKKWKLKELEKLKQ